MMVLEGVGPENLDFLGPEMSTSKHTEDQRVSDINIKTPIGFVHQGSA
jgi:hypothetical protein